MIGTVTFVIQLAIYACVNDNFRANGVFIAMLSIFTLLPLVHLFPLEKSKNDQSVSNEKKRRNASEAAQPLTRSGAVTP